MNASAVDTNVQDRVAALISVYGENGAVPARSQWEALMSLPADAPVTLLNFFKLRREAHYADGSGASPMLRAGGLLSLRRRQRAGP